MKMKNMTITLTSPDVSFEVWKWQECVSAAPSGGMYTVETE